MSTAFLKPTFSRDEARSLLVTHYGMEAVTLEGLPGERDQNFAVSSDHNQRYVLKISGASEEANFLTAQNEALKLVSRHCDFVPRLVPTLEGKPLGSASSKQQRFALRLVSFLPGQPLAEVKFHSPSLLTDLGHKLGQLDKALQSFDHSGIHRDFDWDLQNGLSVVACHVGKIKDNETQQHVRNIHRQLEGQLPNIAPHLRRSAIHNDANDHNTLVATERDRFGERYISGIIDFGDMAWSYTVAELAVAIAYLLPRDRAAVDHACHVVSGYHQVYPLTEAELSALFDLARLRLCVSACMAAHQQQLRPSDAYLRISQAPIRAALPRLVSASPRFAECRFREACGLTPHPQSVSLTRWLDLADLHPVMGVALNERNTEVLDLGMASGLTSECVRGDGIETVDGRLANRMVSRSKPFSLGRFNEPRPIYTAPLFQETNRVTDPTRTIHLGLDVFAPAGTAVYAPLAGRVACVQYNAAPLDYGTVVVLEHAVNSPQPRFYSLYGHLGKSCASQLHLGQPVQAGDVIGMLGTRAENGGYTPHLHLQLIVDALGLDCADRAGTLGDYPGVAFAEQRGTWISLSPNPAALLQMNNTLRAQSMPSQPELIERRRMLTATNLSVSYRRPLHLVRGWMQFMFDDTGRRYLDAYNNVPHVGHCHPRVVAAAHAQMQTLNTNTRYLSGIFNEYAERLGGLFPEGLEVCYLLNSASEANELALRLARAATGRHAIIVQESAYHGHTTSLIDISPYKHNGPGGEGAPEWVHTIPIPDSFRGEFRGDNLNCGRQFAERAARLIHDAAAGQFPPAALITETCPSVGGQILPPPDYLPRVYDAVRAAGAICIADEVQTGFGRLGTHAWAFQRYGVVPEIVVLGKPMGNGHPLAAVVTTRPIADSLANGMEFFSTFGGNNVSCAVGLAVLDVIRDERLQQRALETGERLRTGFLELQRRFSIIGDVRGSGLFWGLELVRSRETLEPADVEADLIANRMRDRGVLIGTDGPDHNVLKIRPPMPFDSDNASLLLATLREILEEEFEI